MTVELEGHMASRWSTSGAGRNGRGGPGHDDGGGRRPRRGRLVLGLGALVLAAALAPAAVAGPEDAAAPDSARAVTSLPAATLPPADPSAPSISALPLAPQARDGDGTQVARSTGPLQLVAVTWTGATPESLALRSTDATGRWGTWLPLDSNANERDDAPAKAAPGGGTDPVWVGDRTQVEVRATRDGRPMTQGLTVQRIDPGTSANDSAIGARARERDASRAGAPPAPAYVTRAQWGADPALMTWPPEYADTTKAVTIHHTAESNDYTPEQSAAIVRGIYAYHSKQNGWGDIGYNALVDKYGTIFEGRAGGMDRPVVAAHAGGFNQETFGIAMMGTLTDTPPTPAELTSVERLAAWKLGGMYRDPAQQITLTSAGGGTSKFAKGQPATVDALFAHRDVGNTECPGNAGYAAMDTIRTETAKLIAAAGTDVRSAWAAHPDLGQPDRVEQPTADGRARFTDFQHGSIYSSAATGAHEVSGPILDAWRARGAERSSLGLPTGDEHAVDGGRAQQFEHGVLRVDGATGAVAG
ncbi:N-acetylmuramoyl-L-alanine amidase [Actinomycetospora endophytica]|uniref:N-acetylmuramoyl-L-alanine amidase n=1 Tax=Actinomycetospora endophytica TaxID=2291215 RepID=A0ABS8P6G6_9PSEU|nr:N-acetylmuramoyl-L-alanine amidase [Actinomycetospora endophytica]MCD2193001.1 N-acetylmuramoyl-L-alanine amidase [Actinomycetospora endophytica]